MEMRLGWMGEVRMSGLCSGRLGQVVSLPRFDTLTLMSEWCDMIGGSGSKEASGARGGGSAEIGIGDSVVAVVRRR